MVKQKYTLPLETYITSIKRIQSKCTTFPFISGIQNDQGIFDGDHDCQSPNNERKCAEYILLAGIVCKGRRINVQRAGANVSVDDSERLIRKPNMLLLKLGKSKSDYIAYHASCHPVKFYKRLREFYCGEKRSMKRCTCCF
jgi:hypothetical protein